MRTVRDAAGNRYLLLKRSAETSLVQAAETGERQYLPTAELTVVGGTSPLEVAASAVPEPARRVVTTVSDDRTLGLLVSLEAADGLSARALLDVEDFCEADLNGLITELRATGVVETATVDGEDGYRLTEAAEAVVRTLQSATSSG